MSQDKDEAQEKRVKDIEEANKDSVKAMEGVRQQKYDREKEEYLREKNFEDQRQYAKVMDELRNRNKTGRKKEDGTEMTHSDELIEHCKRILSEDVQAYTDFRSNLNSMWKLCAKFHEVNTIRAQQVAGELWDKTGHKLGEKLNEKFDLHPVNRLKSFLVHSVMKPHADIDIPTLQQKVSFKDGKVDIQPLTGSDGTPLPNDVQKKVDKAFNIFVATWLAENRYVPHPSEPGKYIHEVTKDELDEATFKRLNETPGKSFSTYLKQTADLEYEERLEDAPRSTGPT